MYSLVVSYKVKLHMHALHIYSKCSVSFILYILTILVYQDVVISAHVGAVIMELFLKN